MGGWRLTLHMNTIIIMVLFGTFCMYNKRVQLKWLMHFDLNRPLRVSVGYQRQWPRCRMCSSSPPVTPRHLHRLENPLCSVTDNYISLFTIICKINKMEQQHEYFKVFLDAYSRWIWNSIVSRNLSLKSSHWWLPLDGTIAA